MQWQHWPHLQRSTLLQCHFLLQHVAQEPPDVVSAGVVTTSSAPPSAHAQPSPEAAWQRRCNGTVGTWCTAALSQEAFPWKVCLLQGLARRTACSVSAPALQLSTPYSQNFRLFPAGTARAQQGLPARLQRRGHLQPRHRAVLVPSRCVCELGPLAAGVSWLSRPLRHWCVHEAGHWAHV